MLSSMRDARSKLIQFKIFNRLYWTPVRINRLGLSQSNLCWRCKTHKGDLLHMFLYCPSINAYWQRGIEKITNSLGTNIILAPTLGAAVLPLAQLAHVSMVVTTDRLSTCLPQPVTVTGRAPSVTTTLSCTAPPVTGVTAETVPTTRTAPTVSVASTTTTGSRAVAAACPAAAALSVSPPPARRHFLFHCSLPSQ